VANLVKLTDAINEIRNGIAHRLTSRGSFTGLRGDARRVARAYERAFKVFEAAHDEFRVAFHSLAKDVFS